MMAACRQELHAAIEMVAQLLLELRSAGEGDMLARSATTC